MAKLARLWVATRTDAKQDSGTGSPVKLNVFAGNNQLKLARTLEPTSDKDFAEGRPGVFELDLGDTDIQTEELDESSFRVEIFDKDAWRPAVILVWAEIDGGLVIPLAIETGVNVTLSTDPTDVSTVDPEIRRSTRIRRVTFGKRPEQVRISHHLIIARTNAADDSGTEADIMLEVRYKDALLEGVLRGPIGKSKATLTFTDSPIILPGSPNPAKNRTTLQSIVLRTSSPDKWLPSSFFLFGVRGRPASVGERPAFLIPLVHIPRWSLGGLSTDSNKGRPSIPLPVAPIPDFPLDDLIPAPDDESIDPDLA